MTEKPWESFVHEGERVDDLQRNGLVILQDPEHFCFGMDAVLLSGMVPAKCTGRCLDLGTGTGILPLLLSAKTQAKEIVGLEIQPESADMARRSVEMNGLSERIHIVQGDLKEASSIFGKASFSVVTCNPPYMTGGHGLKNPEDAKAIARHELLCSFEDVAREAASVLEPGGHFYLVHRPFRLVELMLTLTKYHLEPKALQMVYPYADKEPNMILMECIRGAKRRITVREPLVIFEAPGIYTKTIREEYGF